MKGVNEVASLSEHAGWQKYLLPFIEKNISMCQKDLENGEFEDLKELYVTQEKLKALRQIVQYVDKRQQEFIKQAKKGGK